MSSTIKNLHIGCTDTRLESMQKQSGITADPLTTSQSSFPCVSKRQPGRNPKSCQSAQSKKHESTDSLGVDSQVAKTLRMAAPRPIPSANSASAFTPVFKSGSSSNTIGLNGRQSDGTNNASKSFWQVIANEQQSRRTDSGNDLIRQKSLRSAAHQQMSQSGSKDFAGPLSLKKTISLDSKCSLEQPANKLLNSIQLMRRLGSQYSEQGVPDRLATPSSATLSRNLSILASRIGQQPGQYSFLMGMEGNTGPVPGALDLGPSSLLQQFGSAAKSPKLLNQQTSLGLFGQQSFSRNPYTPLGVSSRKEFEIPQPRLEVNPSLCSFFRDTISTPARQADPETYQESPENNQKERKGRLSGFGSAQKASKGEQPVRGFGMNDDVGLIKQHFQVGNHLNAAAGVAASSNTPMHTDSQLSLSKALQHLKQQLSQGGQREAPSKGGAAFKLKQSNTEHAQDPILDQQGVDRKVQGGPEQSNTKQKSVRISKSGPDRKQIQLVEQESELMKVSYEIEGVDNKRAVFIPGLGIIDDYMASEDLNECVDALLQKRSKAAFQQHAMALESAKKGGAKDAPAKKSGGSAKQNLRLPSFGQGLNEPAKPEVAEAMLKSPVAKAPEASAEGIALLQSTSENSPEGSGRKLVCSLGPGFMPRVVIRHRIKGAKKAQKRIRKNTEQNKILLAEFQKNSQWKKSKIVELQERLGLKMSQIYKWNWDMQRKLVERQGPASQSLSAPDITMDNDHSGRKVSDWTGDFVEVGLAEQMALADVAAALPKEAKSDHAEEDRIEAGEDSLMSDEQAQQEVQSQAAPELCPPQIHCE